MTGGWEYVVAAYAVTLVATAGLAVVTWRAMQRAEAAADDLRRRP